MIVFDLACENGHVFEAWFRDSNNYLEQKEQGLISCPVCGSSSVKKLLSPVRTRKSRDVAAVDGPTDPEVATAMLKAVYKSLVKNSEDVGVDFASEALKMHYGVKEHRSIRGIATEDEEKMLKEEGVEFFRIPVPVSNGKKDD